MFLKIVDDENVPDKPRSYWQECNAKIYHYYYTQTELLLSFARTMPAYALLEQWLPETGLIVDAGCACQEIASLFETAQRHFLGIDFAIQTLKSGKVVFPKASYLAADLQAVPLASASLSFVFAKGIAEHFAAGPQLFLQEMQRLLKPQGKLLLMTNAANVEDYYHASNLNTPYPHLMKKLSAQLVSHFDEINTKGFHAYAMHKNQIARLLKENGFQVTRHHRVGFLDGLMRSRRFGEAVKKFSTQRRIALVQGKPTPAHWQFFDDLFLRERVYKNTWKRLLLDTLSYFYYNYDAFLCEKI